MRLFLVFSIALLSLTSCQKQALVEIQPTENTTKTRVSYTTVDAVRSFINGKWAWKETIVKQRTGQTLSTTPANSGIQKTITITNSSITIFENNVQASSENYKLTHTDAGWLFESDSCSGILYHIGEQLIIVGSVIDRPDDYYERARP